MACQLNPNTYGVVFRCPLEDGARLKTMADEAGLTVSMFVAGIIRKTVGDRPLTETEQTWVADHFEMGKLRRERADQMTKNGYFKKKRVGRPRKPGPRKGWKRWKPRWDELAAERAQAKADMLAQKAAESRAKFGYHGNGKGKEEHNVLSAES